MGALFSSFFLGGWRGPGAEQFPILGLFYLLLKAFLLYFVIMWIKYSLPRIRIDHMLSFNWKFLTPLSLVVVMVTAILDKILGSPGSPLYTIGMLVGNILIIWLTLYILRTYVRLERKKVGEPRPVASSDLMQA